MDRLTAMQVFAEVVKRGSFTAAADHLDISRVKATRYVTQLEQWLEIRLLQRTTRKVSLTQAGESFYIQCKQMITLSEDMESTIGKLGESPSGQLSITASSAFSLTLLADAIADYTKLYPEVHVEVLMDDTPLDLIDDKVDLAIRIASELAPGLVARKIAPCHSDICASPRYLDEKGTPIVPMDLIGHNCLIPLRLDKHEWTFTNDNTSMKVPIRGQVASNSAMILSKVTLSGVGISMLPKYVAKPLIEEGKLVKLFAGWDNPTMNIWGVYHSNRHTPASLKTLLDFLVDRFCGQDF